MKLKSIGVALLLSSALAAQEPSSPTAEIAGESTDPSWTGQGELGLVATSGNTDTTTLNLGLVLGREAEKWRHRFGLALLRADDQGVDTADRLVGEWQTDYLLNQYSYLFAAARHDADEFSGFDYQQTLAVGYGRALLDSEAQTLKVELGPGFRRIKNALTRETESEVIARGLLEYSRTLTVSTTIANRLLIESGSSNTLVENDAALTVAINDDFALAVSVAVRHNTDAPEGIEQTDTLTTASLVYSFD